MTLTKCDWNNKEFNAMDSCYKVYTWINDAILMLLLQTLWKLSQIYNYFIRERCETTEEFPVQTILVSPLTKESKLRRHIRSMSDVQCTTPYYRLAHKSRKGSTPTLAFDSEFRRRRHIREIDSSDSSDYFESVRKIRSIEHNIMKHSDSMRIL